MSHESIGVNPSQEYRDFVMSHRFLYVVQEGQRASGGLLTLKDMLALRLKAEGFTDGQIAKNLDAPMKTVKNRFTRIYQRLQRQDAQPGAFGAVTWCMENGIINPVEMVPGDYEERLESLSPIERRILNASVETRTHNSDVVGRVIYLAPKTVKNSRTKRGGLNRIGINEKLGAKSTAHASMMHMAYTLSQGRQ